MATPMDITVKISRCDPFPLIEPQGYAVGFTIYCNPNGRSTYRDVYVSFSELVKAGRVDLPESGDRSFVLDAAYEKALDGIKIWYNNVATSPVILGSVYTPKVQ
jgi:hypothetical protein